MRPERSADRFSDHEAGLYGPPPGIVDRTGGIFRPAISPVIPYFSNMADARQIPPSPWIMDESIGTPLPPIPPAHLYFPHVVDTSQRHCCTYTRCTSSGFSGTGPDPLIGGHAGTTFRSRRAVPATLPSPTISPTYGFFNLSDQLDISESPTFEEK